MTHTRPGAALLIARLPLPSSGISILGEVAEYLWGPGEYMMSSDGDFLKLLAPLDPLPDSRGPRPDLSAFPSPGDEMQVVKHQVVDGGIRMSLEDAQERIEHLIAAQRSWFEGMGGINYIEAGIGTAGHEPEFTFTLQKREGVTPHDARMQAEAKIAAVIAILDEARDSKLAQEIRAALTD